MGPSGIGALATTSESTDRFVEKCGKLPGFGNIKLIENVDDENALSVIILDFC